MSFMPMPRGHVLPYSPDYYRIQQEQTAPLRPCSRIGSAHSTAIVSVWRGGRCGAPEAQRQPGPPEVGGKAGATRSRRAPSHPKGHGTACKHLRCEPVCVQRGAQRDNRTSGGGGNDGGGTIVKGMLGGGCGDRAVQAC